jgi:hypothetical protein
MKKAFFVVAVAVVACGASACAAKVAPAAKAASVEQLQCDHRPSGEEMSVLQSTTVLGASPLYSHVITGKNDSEERVTGAKLLVRPPEGVSPELLTRIIQCHSARALLGQVDTSHFSDDPYWLPDAWLDIEVKPDNGNYAVVLQAESVPDGLKVLHRATAFAETHRGPTGP